MAESDCMAGAKAVRVARGMTKRIRALSLGFDENEIRYLQPGFRAQEAVKKSPRDQLRVTRR